MSENAKKTAASIVAELGEEGAEKPEAPKLDSLMGELASALRSGDEAGAAQAFKAAVGLCGASESTEDDRGF